MHITLFLSCPDTRFQGEPLEHGRKIQGVRKMCDFRLQSPLPRKRYKIGSCYRTLTGNHMWQIYVGSYDLE